MKPIDEFRTPLLYRDWQQASPPHITIGPILLGVARPIHILTPSATVRGIFNMTALTTAEINSAR